jgi:hypothetical protein
MKGKELLDRLQKMTPEQLEMNVLIEGENRFRNPCYNSAEEISIRSIDDEGEEDEEGDECICLHPY